MALAVTQNAGLGLKSVIALLVRSPRHGYCDFKWQEELPDLGVNGLTRRQLLLHVWQAGGPRRSPSQHEQDRSSLQLITVVFQVKPPQASGSSPHWA
jgi:hypothetical protein